VQCSGIRKGHVGGDFAVADRIMRTVRLGQECNYGPAECGFPNVRSVHACVERTF